jgi:ABC-type multidrug transport system ATPase subunit
VYCCEIYIYTLGAYYPTKGTVIVDGYDIRYYRQKMTRLVSFCYQQNLLSNQLTAIEHLILIGMVINEYEIIEGCDCRVLQSIAK